MRISIIGTGYVGLVTGTCLAEMGNEVWFVDIDEHKLDLIKSQISPIFEPGLEKLLKKNRLLLHTTNNILSAVEKSEITFICVGTPAKDDGSTDLGSVINVTHSLGMSLHLKQDYHVVVMKSTVPPGTLDTLIRPMLENDSEKKSGIDFGIGSNPEFLKEGSAVEDFFHADRIILGTHDPKSKGVLIDLYSSLNVPLFLTDIKTAEMIKYVSNAFLATKISFANEIGNLCKIIGIDTYEVFTGVGLDHRINSNFFRSGLGYGGSCFPKDVKSLIHFSQNQGVNLDILRSVAKINEQQPLKAISLLKKHIEIHGKTIGILGLSFKPFTDDIRESRAIPIVEKLINEGAKIIAYDPLAMRRFSSIFSDIQYGRTAHEILKADAVVIVTEWPEFEDLDYSGKIVIDGRRLEKAREQALVYEGVCW